METLIRPETTGADISTQAKSEALISLLDEYIDYLEEKRYESAVKIAELNSLLELQKNP